jgi:formylglycine-generating enzyme required for sulfatase activity
MARASLFAFTLILVVANAQQVSAPKAKRVALVIGNSNYGSLPKLPSVPKDVLLISDALGKAGFDVHQFPDLKMQDFFAVLTVEASKILTAGDICVVYYVGYAVQGDDDNYLLPVNFDPQDQKELQDRAVHFKRVQETLTDLQVALQIYVLEGPPAINVQIKGSPGQPGLIDPKISTSKETSFICAAHLGDWAPAAPADGVDLLTEVTAKAMADPGVELYTLFDNVRREVSQKTSQNPFHDASPGVSQFYFREAVAKPSETTKPAQPEWPRQGVPVQNRKDREEYLWIKSGTFMMGCAPNDQRCDAAEKPRHTVTLTKDFWMGRNEVQVLSYQHYVDLNAKQKVKMPAGTNFDRHWKQTAHPIVNVKWEDAQAYCTWAGGRLPTEAEWEFAARAGMSDEIYPMNDENSRDKANFRGKSGNDTYDDVAPVRQFDANLYGLYDMAGNVWEWVNDWFSPRYYTADPIQDPQGPANGKEHVIRGGSWDSDPKVHLRISFRKGLGGDGPLVGFRCAIDDTPDTRNQILRPETIR